MSATVVQGGGDLDTLSPQRIRITEPRKVCPAFYNPLVKVHANICPFPPWYKGEIGNPLPKRPRIIQLRKVYASFYNTPAEIHANSCPQRGTRGNLDIPPVAQDFWTKDSTLSIPAGEVHANSCPHHGTRGKGFAHKLYVYVMTLRTKMVVDHLLWDPSPMNMVIRRHKNYWAKKKAKSQTVQIMLAVPFSGNTWKLCW